MNKIIEFFKLIRTVNLLFILFTQYVFYHFIITPIYQLYDDVHPVLNQLNLCLIMLASVCIAAGGYIINDYFDVNIDLINKPDRTFIGKVIKRRSAIILHVLFSLFGIGITGYVAYEINQFVIFVANIICVISLWFYSTTLKKKLFYGNVLISMLTAWVVLILYVCEINFNTTNSLHASSALLIYKYAILYSGFAFLVSLMREIVKDLEDANGDKKNGCSTLPIAWGYPITQMILIGFIYLVIAFLGIMSIYLFLQKETWFMFYVVFFLIFPFLHIKKLISKSTSAENMHRVSNMIKLVMFFGICSMIFYKLPIS